MSEWPGGNGPRGVEQAARVGAYLRDLLSFCDPYSSEWRRHVRHPRSGRLNQAAVARVVAEYLIDVGERRDSPELHRHIKDRVGRALGGRALTPETLEWFINAFDMSPQHADELRALLNDPASPRFIAGRWPAGFTLGSTAPTWRTLSLHELHTVGADGLPEFHRTLQVIRSLTDGLTHYLYRFDTNVSRVDVLRGGAAGPVQDLGGGLFGVEISFPAPLRVGQTASLEYVTTFRYEEPPAPEFRRGILRRVDNVEIRVQFHPHRLPARVLWGTWDDLDGEMSVDEEVEVDAEGAVHRYVAAVQAAIVGFRWEW